MCLCVEDESSASKSFYRPTENIAPETGQFQTCISTFSCMSTIRRLGTNVPNCVKHACFMQPCMKLDSPASQPFLGVRDWWIAYLRVVPLPESGNDQSECSINVM